MFGPVDCSACVDMNTALTLVNALRSAESRTLEALDSDPSCPALRERLSLLRLVARTQSGGATVYSARNALESLHSGRVVWGVCELCAYVVPVADLASGVCIPCTRS